MHVTLVYIKIYIYRYACFLRQGYHTINTYKLLSLGFPIWGLVDRRPPYILAPISYVSNSCTTIMQSHCSNYYSYGINCMLGKPSHNMKLVGSWPITFSDRITQNYSGQLQQHSHHGIEQSSGQTALDNSVSWTDLFHHSLDS